MIVAIDTNCVLPGRVGGIESYTLTLVRSLLQHADWIDQLFLLTRPENENLFSTFAGPRCAIVPVPRPATAAVSTSNWAAAMRGSPCAAAQALHAHQEAKTRLISECRADVVHFPGNTINPIDLDVPAVLNLHDLQHRHLPQYFTADDLANRERWWTASAQRADAIVTSTRFVADDVGRELGVDAQRIFVAPLPVDDFFSEPVSDAEVADLRRRLELAPTTLLYPAALWPHKNHARLVRAFIAARIPDSQLVLTGFPSEDSMKVEGLRAAEASGAARVLGRVDRAVLRGLYHACTAMIFPSEYEASSFPIIEAMASGCPVAASNIPSLRELVAEAGLLFDPRDDAGISNAMTRLAADESLRRELTRRGRRRVAEFTPEVFLRDIRTAYEHAIANRRRVAA